MTIHPSAGARDTVQDHTEVLLAEKEGVGAKGRHLTAPVQGASSGDPVGRLCAVRDPEVPSGRQAVAGKGCGTGASMLLAAGST